MIKSVFTIKIEAWVGISVIVFVAVSLGVVVMSKISDFNNYVDLLNSEYSQEGIMILSLKEINRIENWIEKSNLNEYGDPIGTFYIGGTPLFNEMTGEKINRFEYIAKNHPDRPWRF
jgi:hypothetical protein